MFRFLKNIVKSFTKVVYFIVLLQVSIYCLPSYSSGKSDSLMNVLKTAKGDEKFTALKALSKLYKSTDPQKCLDYAKQEVQQAKDLHNRSYEAEAFNDVAIPLLLMQENRKAIDLLLESTRIFDSLSDKPSHARSLNNLGIAWSQNGSNEKALECFHAVIPFYTETRDTNKLGLVYMNIGLLYERLRMYDKALSASLKALDIFISLKNQRMISDISVNLGITYTSQKKFREAEPCFNQAVRYYETTGNTFGLAVAETNLAKMFKEKGDYPNAVRWFNQSLPLIRSIKNEWAEAGVYFDLSTIHSAKGEWYDALAKLELASKLNEKAADQELQSQIYYSLYVIYDTLGNDKTALRFFKKYSYLHDSLLSIRKTKLIEELTLGFEIQQKETENKLLKQEIKAARNRQWILGVTMIALILASILIIIILILKRRNLALKKEQAEQEKRLKESELQKSQVQNKLKEEENERLLMEVQLKEQDLVYQTLQKLDLTNLNRSVFEKLSPFHIKITNKKDQNEFMQLLESISRDAGKEPMADFEIMFKQLHKSFYEKLVTRCPSFSKTELQVCALLRINLSTKDIARLLNLSSSSVDMIRHRIRQKVELDQKQSLTAFLITL